MGTASEDRYVCHGDDSGRQPYFVVGGLTAKIDDWIALTIDWQAALDERPRIDYFKCAEALKGYGEFNKRRFPTAPKRSARVRSFIAAINRHCLRGDAAIMDTIGHKRAITGKISATLDQPFQPTYTGLMLSVTMRMAEQGIAAPIDFIFDTMDETTLLEIRRSHLVCKREALRRGMPAVAANFGQPPITADDKVVIALQAADLWAGLVRQGFEDDQAGRVSVARKWLSLIKRPNYVAPGTRSKS